MWTLVPASLDGDPKNWLLLRKDADDGAAGRRYQPMLATSSDRLPSGEGWVFEPKWDGFRAIVTISGGEVTLTSRNGNDLTERFRGAARAAAHVITTPDAVLDGEICVLDHEGRSRFSLLQESGGTVVLVLFDVLEVDSVAVVDEPLAERRKQLEGIVGPSNEVFVSPQFDDGAALLAAARDQELEGVVAKKTDSPYKPGRRSTDWHKLKLRRTQEVVIAGYTRGQGRRTGGFGALVVGIHDAGVLRWAGNVGTGFSDSEITRLLGLLAPLRRSDSPFAEVPKMPRVRRSDVTWVEPKLVAEVEFAEWTHEGRLRSPTYLRVQEDKPAAEVRRERAPLPPVVKLRGRELRLSNLDKPFWSEEGITKGDLVAYYRDVAEALVPHLRGRPFTMKRYPDGWQGKSFFQKNAPSHMPDWIERAPFPASTRDGEKRIVEYAVVNDELALLWMANMGCIDLHTWASRVDRPERPGLGDVRSRPVRGLELRGGDRGRAAGQGDARSPRARELPEDLWFARDPRPRPHRAPPLVRGGSGVRGHRRRRARSSSSGPCDDRVGEREAPRRPRRREPERAWEDECERVLGAPAGRRARLDAAALGGGRLRPRPHELHDGRGPRSGVAVR